MSGHSIPVSHRSEGEGARHRIAPPVDVFETAEGVLLVADVPGCTADTLSIEVEDDTLAIEGAAAFSAPAGFQERLGENEPILYVRSFKLRPDLDPAKISASLKDGVLAIQIPRTHETRARRIEIRTS